MSNFCSIPLEGFDLEDISVDSLEIPKARESARALLDRVMDWVELLSCHRHTLPGRDQKTTVAETIVFETEVQLPQITVNEINRFERIAVTFRVEDKNYPRVFALRDDFPDVVHLNAEIFELPKSICLYEEPYADVKLKWTAISFIERIRQWLADTATGTLHRPDQALEPLLLANSGSLILPSAFFSGNKPENLPRLTVSCSYWNEGTCCFIAREEEMSNDINRKEPIFSLVQLIGLPQVHGRLQRTPEYFTELAELLVNAEINLLDRLRSEIKNLDRGSETDQSGLLLLAILPKSRDALSGPEINEIKAFVCIGEEGKLLNLGEIGEELGVLAKSNEGYFVNLIGIDQKKIGEKIKLLTLSPCSALSRDNAPRFSGTGHRFTHKISAIGMGALGSQLFMNMVRSSDGEWVVIDKDILLPHNLARHASFGATVGHAKSEILAHFANTTIDGLDIARSIKADVLEPRKNVDSINEALRDSQIILDLSASVPVARHLAINSDSTGRRISLFLNPSGTDLVMLAEDTERTIRLDSLEMQYYRLLLNNESLHEHLRSPDGQVRYSASCREITSQISGDLVAQAAAIGSRFLKRIMAMDDAFIAVWKTDSEGQVVKITSEAFQDVTEDIGEWTVRADRFLLEKIRRRRLEKLPVETGGPLVGSCDMQRKIIYVVDTLPAPKDSVEGDMHFIRGSYGLRPQIEEVRKITLGNLDYVGDWHSHPPRCSSQPSNDDRKLLESITSNLRRDGKPALMLIAGDQGEKWYLSE